MLTKIESGIAICMFEVGKPQIYLAGDLNVEGTGTKETPDCNKADTSSQWDSSCISMPLLRDQDTFKLYKSFQKTSIVSYMHRPLRSSAQRPQG